MMRNRPLTDEEKARAVLCRTGRPGNECACLSEAEIAALASIYDKRIAPEAELRADVDQFWAARLARMSAKTASNTGPNFFRNARRR